MNDTTANNAIATVSQYDLFAKIGMLTVENDALRKHIHLLTQQVRQEKRDTPDQ